MSQEDRRCARNELNNGLQEAICTCLITGSGCEIETPSDRQRPTSSYMTSSRDHALDRSSVCRAWSKVDASSRRRRARSSGEPKRATNAAAAMRASQGSFGSCEASRFSPGTVLIVSSRIVSASGTLTLTDFVSSSIAMRTARERVNADCPHSLSLPLLPATSSVPGAIGQPILRVPRPPRPSP